MKRFVPREFCAAQTRTTDLIQQQIIDRKSTRLNSSHANISYAVFCLKKKKKRNNFRNNDETRALLSLRNHKATIDQEVGKQTELNINSNGAARSENTEQYTIATTQCT